MPRKATNLVSLGSTYTDIGTGVSGFPVQPPKWAGDRHDRVTVPGQVRLVEHELGWTIDLDGKPLVSINAGDLEALGVALIRASARRS